MPNKKASKKNINDLSNKFIDLMIKSKKDFIGIEIVMAIENAEKVFIEKYLTKEIKPVKLTNK